mmetsp:Transcript_25554/g.54970  ORF Transcript_25554/g.54970 Transcript_25554/m.54970 type:complete len:676 (+) Transcript_25554:151-2178(+)
MSILLETTFGDLVLDLDVDGSPALCKNILKLAKARYYTNTLIYNIVPGRYCQMGDPNGDGTGGCSIHGLIESYQSSVTSDNKLKPPRPDVTQSQRRFLQSQGRLFSPDELSQKGVVIAMEMGNVPHTIGSQFLFTLSENNGLKDLVSSTEGDGGNNDGSNNAGQNNPRYLSLGTIAEDSQNVLSKLNRAYCDDDGRPYADIRIQRALVIHDPFDDPAGMDDLLKWRGVKGGDGENGSDHNLENGYLLAPQSPTYEHPPEETVPVRIQADDTTLFATAGWDDNDASREYEDEDEEDEATRQKRLELQEKQEEEWRQKQDTSRAVMLEMLGDRPTADIKAPEDVLFVCKLNPLTNDEDLELIFSRFDAKAKAEIIRDPDTGVSLQYAFVEFTSNETCNEAYLKMNNALVDDRRIRVDFSQSVAKVWDRYQKQYRMGDRSGIDRGFVDGGRGSGRGQGRGRGTGGGQGRGTGGGRGRGPVRGNRRENHPSNHHSRDQLSYRPKGHQTTSMYDRQEKEDSEFDSFGRMVLPKDANDTQHTHHNKDQRRNRHPRGNSRSRSPSRDIVREERRRRSRSGSRHRNHDSRRNRSRSDDSSDYSRRKKKHRKHQRREDGSRRKRSGSREREKKHKKHRRHHHRQREYSDEDDERHDDRKHHRRHRTDDDKHKRKRGDRSRSRSR